MYIIAYGVHRPITPLWESETREDPACLCQCGAVEDCESCRCWMLDDIEQVVVMSHTGRTVTHHKLDYGTWPTGIIHRFRTEESIT